jgi:hypothetical protein
MPDSLLPIGILLAGFWFALVAHEIGHIAAGLLMRWRFGLLALGPFWLARDRGRVRLRWNRIPAAWGGIALAYPTDTRRFVQAATVVAAGGPLASASVAVLAYATAGAFGPGTLATRLATALAIMSAGVLVATAQPFGTFMGPPSDGGRVLMFFRDRSAAEAWGASWPLAGMSMAGVRPRDWDEQFIDLAESVQHPPAPMLLAKEYLLRHWLDRGEAGRAAAAASAMATAYDDVGKAVRRDVAGELAFYFAFVRHDPDQARRYLADAAGGERHRFHRAQAAILARSSDSSGARVAVQRARAALARPGLESTAMDLELIEAVEREIPTG